jgi:hypothetical protein
MDSVNFRPPKFIYLSHASAVILEGVDNSSSNINDINRLNPAKGKHHVNYLLAKNF